MTTHYLIKLAGRASATTAFAVGPQSWTDGAGRTHKMSDEADSGVLYDASTLPVYADANTLALPALGYSATAGTAKGVGLAWYLINRANASDYLRRGGRYWSLFDGWLARLMYLSSKYRTSRENNRYLNTANPTPVMLVGTVDDATADVYLGRPFGKNDARHVWTSSVDLVWSSQNESAVEALAADCDADYAALEATGGEGDQELIDYLGDNSGFGGSYVPGSSYEYMLQLGLATIAWLDANLP